MIDYKNHEILDNAGDLYTAMGWAVARGKGRPCKDYETSKRVFSCCAGAAIYRMDIMRKIGGLDEHHFAYLEDLVIVQEFMDLKIGIFRKLRFTMLEVLQQAHVIMKRRYFLQQEILFL